MIRTAITARISVRGIAGVLGDDEGEVIVEAGVGVVGDDARGAAGRVASHVLVEVGDDGQTLGGVVAEDIGRSKEALLLAGVPMELKSIGGCEASLDQDTKRLQKDDCARGVVVGARGRVRGSASGRVKVSTDDDYKKRYQLCGL